MIRIALVEDDPAYVEQLTSYLREYEKESKERISVQRFSDGEDIVTGYRADYDIILMDVEMRFMDGMSAAEAIRKMDTEVVIIFITNMPQYAIQGYRVDALDYVLKPVSYFAFTQRIDRALTRLKKRKKKYLTIAVKGGMMKLDLSEICYVEVQDHDLIYHTVYQDYRTKGTMRDAEESLADGMKEERFFRCNRCYLVNLDFVENFQGIDVTVNGDCIQVSRARKKAFLNALNDFMNEKRIRGVKRYVTHLVFLAAIVGFMEVTDGVRTSLFLPCMLVSVSLFLIYIYRCCQFSLAEAGYYCARAFISGEFAASFGWQIYYYTVKTFQVNHAKSVQWVLLVVVYAVIFGILYLLEKYLQKGGKEMHINRRELFTVLIITAAVFAVSNLSYIDKDSPFSSQFAAEMFIIRTLVDMSGMAVLYAYHIQVRELQMKFEVDTLQNILQMQYKNYQLSQESIEIVNQKYHDLKHQIALLKSEAGSPKSVEYLEKMEKEIKIYEAQNKTGNKVLDAVLTSKSLYCQNNGIGLTCVADGSALNFMEDMDISALFGNILDNAIESVQKLNEQEKRLIHLSVAKQKQFLRIRCENYCEEQLKFENGMPVTTKKDRRFHGFGMKSIKSTAAKYGGSVTTDLKKNWFELRILIPLS